MFAHVGSLEQNHENYPEVAGVNSGYERNVFLLYRQEAWACGRNSSSGMKY